VDSISILDARLHSRTAGKAFGKDPFARQFSVHPELSSRRRQSARLPPWVLDRPKRTSEFQAAAGGEGKAKGQDPTCVSTLCASEGLFGTSPQSRTMAEPTQSDNTANQDAVDVVSTPKANADPSSSPLASTQKRSADDAGIDDDDSGSTSQQSPKEDESTHDVGDDKASEASAQAKRVKRGSPSGTLGSPKPHVGWNRGVTNNLRTSFGGGFSRLNTLRKPPTAPASQNEQDATPQLKEERNAKFEEGSSSASRPDAPALSTKEIKEVQTIKLTQVQTVPQDDQRSLTAPESVQEALQFSQAPTATTATSTTSQEAAAWIQPPPRPAVDFENIRNKDQQGWEGIFLSWCKSLNYFNNNSIRASTARERHRILETYFTWVGSIQGISKAKASSARRAAVEFAQSHQEQLAEWFLQTSTPEIEPTMESLNEPKGPEAIENGADTVNNQASLTNATITDMEIEHRAHYFPGAEIHETFCIVCASSGHSSNHCPDLTCKHCQADWHRPWQCPTRQRCGKCKQLGHHKRQCREKLILPVDERDCAHCASRDHQDHQCPTLVKSFIVREGEESRLRKVQAVPIYCYSCGAKGHYGPECWVNRNQPRNADPWAASYSVANAARYVDPASTEIAVAYQSARGSTQPQEDDVGRPNLGHSIVPQRHIVFEDDEDDDEDEGFIRPLVSRNQPGAGNRAGQIRIAGTASAGGRGAAGLPPRPPHPAQQQLGQQQGGGGGSRKKRRGGR